MTYRLHFYKGFEIRNTQKQTRSKHPAFHILPHCGRDHYAVAATTSLKSARWLIDVWTESRYCACGAMRMLYDYRCARCAQKGEMRDAALHQQHRRAS